jgi:hypothetical protein
MSPPFLRKRKKLAHEVTLLMYAGGSGLESRLGRLTGIYRGFVQSLKLDYYDCFWLFIIHYHPTA